MSCSFTKYSGVPCGAHPRLKQDIHTVPLLSCQKDVTSHVSYYNIAGIQSEVDLILSRIGNFSNEPHNLTICPFHRDIFGIGWKRSSRVCSIPKSFAFHKNPGKLDRGIGRTQSQRLFTMSSTQVLVPVGAGICRTCRKGLASAEICEPQEPQEPDIDMHVDEITARIEAINLKESTNLMEGLEDMSISEASEASEVMLSSSSQDEVGSSNQKEVRLLNNYLQACGKSQVIPMLKSWEDSSDRSKRRHLNQAREAILTVLQTLAPESVGQLWSAVSSSNLNSEEPELSIADRKLVEALAECFLNAADWSTQRQILSIMADKLQFKELKHFLPEVTHYRFRIARQHQVLHGRGVAVPLVKHTRMRVDPAQLDHFLTFITSPHVIQDMPFGEKVTKLTSGEVLHTPNVIRTMISSTIIRQYIQYCEESSFIHLSEKTLRRILDVCPASTRKSLQGLDYFTADGGKAYDELQDIISRLVQNGMSDDWGRKQKSALRASKRYMKTEYKIHTCDSSTVPDHCRFYALSDSKDSDFQIICDHQHNEICSQCQILHDVINEIDSAFQQCQLGDDDKAEMQFMVRKCIDDILLWKAHQLRSVNQEKGRTDILEMLDDKSVFVTQDWAMKFIPQKYRESQSDWFGKRGISWHVSVVIRRSNNDEFESLTLVHITNAQQDSSSVINIMHHVVKTVKIVMPGLENVYYRQDNAGCYHCINTIVGLKGITDKTVNVNRMDFSDPQGGKGSCDRKAATIKSHIRIYINEGKDVESLHQMKMAIESNGGVRGVATYIISVPKQPQEAQRIKLGDEKISLLNNFQLTDTGIRLWRAYNIGNGRCIELTEDAREYGEYDIVENPIHAVQFAEIKPRIGATQKGEEEHIFCCPEDGCVRSFSMISELEHHINTEKHTFASNTLLDKACLSYTSKIIQADTSVPWLKSTETVPSAKAEIQMGWALKTPKKSGRFTSTQTSYLQGKFQHGEDTGNKLDPAVVSKQMQTVKDNNGQKLFTQDDYLTARQIQSFFSREAARRRAKTTVSAAAEAEHDDDVSTAAEEFTIKKLNDIVNNALSFMHPIVINDINLCDIVRQKHLTKVKLVALKDMCNDLSIDTSGFKQHKKAPYVDKIEEFVLTCTCFK